MNAPDYLSAVFSQVLLNTLWASALMPLLALLWRRLPPWWRCGLGAVITLRLLLPITPEFAWSAERLLLSNNGNEPEASEARAMKAFPPAAETPADSTPSPDNLARALEEASATQTPGGFPSRALAAAPFVWLGGAALFGAWLTLSQIRFSLHWRRKRAPAPSRLERELESCRVSLRMRRRARLWLVRDLPCPLACGILRPRVLLPEGLADGLSAAELRHVLRHELAHHRAHDLLWNLLFAAARTLHWFHPAVHFGIRELLAQRETLRDADALRAAPAAEAESYAGTLLKLLRPAPSRLHFFQAPALTSGMPPALRHLKQRLAMTADIVSRPRPAARLAFAGIAALLALTTFTKAQEDQPARKGAETSPENSSTDKSIVFKLQNTRIPRMTFVNARVDEAVEFLKRKAMEPDQEEVPEKRGVNFLLRGSGNETVTCDLRDITLLEAIKTVCDLGNSRFRIEPNAIVITHKSVVDPPQTRIYRTPPGFAELTRWDADKPEEYPHRLRNATGIDLKEPSTVSFDPGMGRLTVRSSLENHDALEMYIDEAFRSPGNIDLFLTEKGVVAAEDGRKITLSEQEVRAWMEAEVKARTAKVKAGAMIWTDSTASTTEVAKLLVAVRSAGVETVTIQPLTAAGNRGDRSSPPPVE